MRIALPLALLAAAPLLAAPQPAVPGNRVSLADPLIVAARKEVARATAEEQRLTAAASRANDEARKLADQQRAAAAGIAAAEARIDLAEGELAAARRAEATQQARLAERQAPAAALVAGLVSMGRRPPLLALADGSPQEFVRVRALLDATMPAIRARTAALTAELAATRASRLAAEAARDNLARQRASLGEQRARFAELERRALARQSQLAVQAIGAGDATLSGGESLAALSSESSRRANALAAARELAKLAPLPPRPSPPDGRSAAPPFVYQLPVVARLSAGLGSVDVNGVRSRGLTLATPRGVALAAPADGTIAFSGPFRRVDGVVIIDHGGGWLSLLVNVASTLPTGSRVRRGDPLGRALGPIQVELSRDGANISPAFIAASSLLLSKGAKPG